MGTTLSLLWLPNDHVVHQEGGLSFLSFLVICFHLPPWHNIEQILISRSGEGGHNDSGRSSGSRYRPDITLGTSSIGITSSFLSFSSLIVWVTFAPISDRRSGKSVDRKSSDSDYSGSGSRRWLVCVLRKAFENQLYIFQVFT